MLNVQTTTGEILFLELGAMTENFFADEVAVDEARKAPENFPGVIVRDNPAEMIYPQPLETSGKDAVEVGRIRKDFSIDHGLNLWVCGDQIRKGAALNALQIAERMIADELI